MSVPISHDETAKRLATIRDLAPSHTLSEIGVALGISGERVRQVADWHGIKIPAKRAWRTEAKEARLAKLRAAGWCPGSKYKHSDDLREKIKSLKGTMSAAKIAAHLGLQSRNVVIGIRHRP